MKRCLFQLAWLFFLGAIITVVVAFVCARWSPEVNLKLRSPAIAQATWLYLVDPNDRYLKYTQIDRYYFGCTVCELRATNWYSRDGQIQSGWAQVVEAGFPLRCFHGTRMSNEKVQRGNGTWPPPSPIYRKAVAKSQMKDRIIPFLPRWPELVINSIFYALIIFALIQIVRFGRMARRRYRQQCPLCAYDLRGDLSSGCPECGWGREAEA